MKQKSNENKIVNTSGASTSSTTNTIERKISIEEKRSVTNSRSSINNSQQLSNEIAKVSTTNEHSKHSVTPSNVSNNNEEVDNELLDDSNEGRCIVM